MDQYEALEAAIEEKTRIIRAVAPCARCGLVHASLNDAHPPSGIGCTTAQLRVAPKYAMFLWPDGETIDYPRRIALEVLQRFDLTFFSPRSLGGLEQRLRGTRYPLLLDHSLPPDDERRAFAVRFNFFNETRPTSKKGARRV